MPEAKGVWRAEEVALVLIDYQKEMFENVRSETGPDEIELDPSSIPHPVATAFPTSPTESGA